MTNKILSAGIAAALLSLASPAAADDANLDVSTFATLDRTGSSSHAAVDMGFTFFTADELDGAAARWDIHGQYVHPDGYGGYLAVPITRGFLDDDFGVTEMANEAYLGNIELGGLYDLELNDKASVAFRAGVTLPTASDTVGGLLANANATLAARLTDVALVTPESVWIRLGASPTVRHGRFFGRVDAGVDVPVKYTKELDGGLEMTGDLDPLARLNVGVGAHAGPVALMAEFANLAWTGEIDDGQDRFLHSAAVTARLNHERYQPSISVATPLDEDTRGEAIAVTAGMQVAF